MKYCKDLVYDEYYNKLHLDMVYKTKSIEDTKGNKYKIISGGKSLVLIEEK